MVTEQGLEDKGEYTWCRDARRTGGVGHLLVTHLP